MTGITPQYSPLFSSPPSLATIQEELTTEKAEVQKFIDSWQEKTKHLPADQRNRCMQRVKSAAQGLLQQLALTQDLSKGNPSSPGARLQETTSQSIAQLNRSIDGFYQSMLQSAEQRKATQQAQDALGESLNRLSLPGHLGPSAASTSSAAARPTGTGIWQTVENNARALSTLSTTPQTASNPSTQHLAFPGERELNRCLNNHLGPYLNEHGVTNAISTHFAGTTYHSEELHSVVQQKLALINQKLQLPLSGLTSSALNIERALPLCARPVHFHGQPHEQHGHHERSTAHEASPANAIGQEAGQALVIHRVHRQFGHRPATFVEGALSASHHQTHERENPVRQWLISAGAHIGTAKLVEFLVHYIPTHPHLPAFWAVSGAHIAAQGAQALEPRVQHFLTTASPEILASRPTLKGNARESLNPLLHSLTQPDPMETTPRQAAHQIQVILMLAQMPSQALNALHGTVMEYTSRGCDAVGLTDERVSQVVREMLEGYARIPSTSYLD